MYLPVKFNLKKSINTQEEILKGYEALELNSIIENETTTIISTLNSLLMSKNANTVTRIYKGLESITPDSVSASMEGVMDYIRDAITRILEWLKEFFRKKSDMEKTITKEFDQLKGKNLDQLNPETFLDVMYFPSEATEIIDNNTKILESVAVVLQAIIKDKERSISNAISAFVKHLFVIPAVVDSVSSSGGNSSNSSVAGLDTLLQMMRKANWGLPSENNIGKFEPPEYTKGAHGYDRKDIGKLIVDLKKVNYSAVSQLIRSSDAAMNNCSRILEDAKKTLTDTPYENHIRQLSQLLAVIGKIIALASGEIFKAEVSIAKAIGKLNWEIAYKEEAASKQK